MRILFVFVALSFTGVLFGQRDLTPNKRSKAFGSRDFKTYTPYGMQFQFGPAFMATSKKTNTFDLDHNTTHVGGNYTHTNAGNIGFYAELGMMHFPKKRSKLSKRLKYVFVSYYDWGIGYKHIGGAEKTTVNYNNAAVVENDGSFYHGHVFGRFSLHKNFYLGEEKKYFIDNGLGINVDYRLVQGNSFYTGEVAPGQRSLYNNLVAQLHYSLGFGIKVRRGLYVIPGVRTPILGYQQVSSTVEANGNGSGSKAYFGNPSFQWFSSKYWPVYAHVKIMFLFEKKTKGCKGADTNSQDKETQRKR